MTTVRPGHLSDLNVLVGRKCNASCAHCSVFSSPDATARMAPETLTAVIRLLPNFARLGPGGRVLATGGEPLLFAAELAMLSAAVHRQGLRFGVETNAYWAKDEKIARRLLERYAIDALIISASRFHAAFVPVERVLTAYWAARALGLDATVRLSLIGEDGSGGLLALLRSAIETDRLILDQVVPFGRAEAAVAFERRIIPGEGSPLACPSDGPIVMEDGRVDPCCGPLSSLVSHALEMGSVHADDAIDRIGRDPVYGMIHQRGLRAFVEALERRGFSARQHLREGDACSVCAAIMSDTNLVGAIADLRAGSISEPTGDEQSA